MRLTDLFLALPILPLLLVMMLLFREPLNGAFGPETGIFILIVTAIGITSWMPTARIVRGDVLALKEREFVLSARSIGTKNSRIITRHILPNVLSPIMVSATLGIANAIITESALSFLGLAFHLISRHGAVCYLMQRITYSNIPSACFGLVWRFLCRC